MLLRGPCLYPPSDVGERTKRSMPGPPFSLQANHTTVKCGATGEVGQVSHGKDEKVSGMLTAESYLNIILDRGKRKLPLDDVYRQMFNPDFSLRSYAKLYKNDGAMTPGTTGETVDGMSLDKVDRVIEAIRYERWKWPPVRRTYIDKPKGGKRPLGMPDWSPKVVAHSALRADSWNLTPCLRGRPVARLIRRCPV